MQFIQPYKKKHPTFRKKIMQIGSLYKGSEHYGGAHHDLGLFRIAKIGKKFVSLREIKCKAIEDSKESVSDGLQSSGSTRYKACMPFKDVHIGRSQLVSRLNWDEEDDCFCAPNGGSGCSKHFERVLQDDNGDFIFTLGYQSYY